MTYSIVARDPATGELGVAVQSHWFSVGPIVPWAQPGVGAVATQANAEVSYGPRGLELMSNGVPAPDALKQLLTEDSEARTRQVAMIDVEGRVCAHTGAECIAFAGDIQGDEVSCQANIMVSERVWPEMLEAYLWSSGPLKSRLLAALDAAEAAGGDARGRQSAAILVVPGEGAPWETIVSLRVEDHPDPLVELRRLVALNDAYELASEGDEAIGEGRHDDAARMFELASTMAPDNHELMFWAGLGAAQGGDLDRGAAQVRAAIALQPGWRGVLARLTPETAPSAAAVLAKLDS